ncbi:unnamed protein product, partial [Mesorhabditis spiculigera]
MTSSSDEWDVELSPGRITTNIVALYGFGALVLVLPYFVGPFQRGFWCDDETIRYEFKQNTVSASALFGFAIVVALATTFWGEFVVQSWIEKRRKRYRLRNRSIHSLLVHILREFGYSQLGFITVLCLMQSTKFLIGRLRPHFLAVCEIENLEQLCDKDHKFIPVGQYKCSATSTKAVHEARLSFFSGHSAISVYAAFYAILYLQAKLGRYEPTKIFVSLAQTMLMCISLAICYTRITDNWHHWSDVLVGIFVGMGVAIWTAVFWARLFSDDTTVPPALPVYKAQERPMRPNDSGNTSGIDSMHDDSPRQPGQLRL